MSRHPARQEIVEVLDRLKEMFPTPGAMEFGSPYHALVAVLLSARTRDEQVLKLLPGFFQAYPTVEELAQATPKDIQEKINTIGMYRQKAKHLHQLAERVVHVYNGQIPQTIDELTTLAGVGRKTASVVLPFHFDTPAIAVDTHVHRVTNRLGWVKTKRPEQTEKALLKLIPKEQAPTVNRVFVKHGRYVCIKNPRCWMCPLADVCSYGKKNREAPDDAEAIRKDIQRREAYVQTLREQIDQQL